RRGDQLAVGRLAGGPAAGDRGGVRRRSRAKKRIRVEVCPSDRGLCFKAATPGQVYRTTKQRDAQQGAVQWCRAEAAAGKRLTLKIKRPNGKIRDERTNPSSSDPKRSKG